MEEELDDDKFIECIPCKSGGGWVFTDKQEYIIYMRKMKIEEIQSKINGRRIRNKDDS